MNNINYYNFSQRHLINCSPLNKPFIYKKNIDHRVDIKSNYFMKKKNILVFAALCLIMQSIRCSGYNNAFFYRAIERGDVDIVQNRAGLIRTVYCDIYIEHVDNEGWQHLKDFAFLRGNGKGNPAPVCFHFIIENTWKRPFQIDRIEILHDGRIIQSEDFLFIKDKNYMENRYSINIASLMKIRRILTDENLLKEIDFADDTVEYRLDFIAPGDRISCFRLFSWFPVGKSTKVRIAIKYFDLKKVIDFDIGRFEYNETMQE